MTNLRLHADSRDGILAAVRDRVDAGAGPGKLRIYSGAQPASADDAPGGATLLAELEFSEPCAGEPVDGSLEFDPITKEDAALATATATWARVVNGDGDTVFDCDVGEAGTTVVLNETDLVAGGPVSITEFSLTMPAG